MTRKELIAYDKWLTRRKWGTGEIISPERAADIYLAEHSLLPAEGAEQLLKRKYADDKWEPNFSGIIEVMTAFAAQPQPTAEGAEKSCSNCRFHNSLTYHDKMWCRDCQQLNHYEQKQPPAEGAEEIFASIVESLGEPINIHNHIFEIRPYTVEHKTEWWIFHKEVGSGEPLAQWLQNFATLHAQRIADKMVSERLMWIRVSDELPKEHQQVLCYNGYRISQHSWNEYTNQDANWFKNTFTHWSTLPKLPDNKS